MVLSYSFRDEILRARLSLMRASRSVRMRRSFWILAAAAGGGGRVGWGSRQRHGGPGPAGAMPASITSLHKQPWQLLAARTFLLLVLGD